MEKTNAEAQYDKIVQKRITDLIELSRNPGRKKECPNRTVEKMDCAQHCIYGEKRTGICLFGFIESYVANLKAITLHDAVEEFEQDLKCRLK